MKNFFKDLQERGIIGQYTQNLCKIFDQNCVKAYLGIDPTADSLHIGHLIPIITLKKFQKYGHKPFLLIGGATGMIGDPSFKKHEREFLDIDTIKYNVESLRNKLLRFLDFESNDTNCAEIINNIDWYSNINVVNFLREAGKHISVNYMLAKESVKKRFDTGISFTEFSYQILQAYDFYYLYKKYGVILQIGGDDQWGNITSGVDFIRKKTSHEVNALTIKLLTKEDGTKFGKTECGTIWLDPIKTSPYEFYNFWINRSDNECERYIKFFSFKNIKEIEEIINIHKKDTDKRLLQKELAKEMTIFVHGKEEYDKISNVSDIIFCNNDFDNLLKIKDIELFLKNIKNISIQKNEILSLNTYYDLLCTVSIPHVFTSKSNIKRCLEEKSVYINKKRIENIDEKIDNNIFSNKFFIIQHGKKKYFVVFMI